MGVARGRFGRRRDNPGVIPRYTRPEIGALWTDQARMDSWLRVELAAAEELDEPTEAEREAIRVGQLQRSSGQRARADHRP